MGRPTLEELQDRIRASERYYGGALPIEAVHAWGGYLAALIERGLLSVGDHATLTDLLPKVEGDAVLQILLGWESKGEWPEWIVRGDA